MTPAEMEKRIVRYGDLQPCKTAFIDAHTPGSDQKENFTIIGGGVSESPDQHVHIKETPGFNIGGAAQPAGCHNSLHAHRTAEVFIIHSGTWRFIWGLDGTDGHVDLDPGDLISIPTHMFRGFKNVTAKTSGNPTGYGFMFAVLGGDDAGGGGLASVDCGGLLSRGALLEGNRVRLAAKPKPTIEITPDGSIKMNLNVALWIDALGKWNKRVGFIYFLFIVPVGIHVEEEVFVALWVYSH